MLKKVYVQSISYRYSFWISRRLNVCWPHPTLIYMRTCTCTQIRKASFSFSVACFNRCFTHVTCMSCNMHVACMENVPNPCMLHETCMLHACRYKWNLHITCAKVSACHHLKYACNMHVICTRFRIGMLYMARTNLPTYFRIASCTRSAMRCSTEVGSDSWPCPNRVSPKK